MLRALLAACKPNEGADSGIAADGRASMASFSGGRLVSVAQYRERASRAGDLGVLTHPSHRGDRHASAVISAVVEQALAQNTLVLYRTLLSNTSAVRVSQRLGFRLFASHVAVRLRH
jgi:predicted GNAT family acetyltransferase